MAKPTLPFLQISPHSGVPIWRQVVDQVLYAVGVGLLKKGDPLPTLRDLSSELGVNINTLIRAFRELERLGVVEMTRGVGTRIAGPPALPVPPETLLKNLLDEFLLRATRLGLSPEQAIQILQKKLEEMKHGGQS